MKEDERPESARRHDAAVAAFNETTVGALEREIRTTYGMVSVVFAPKREALDLLLGAPIVSMLSTKPHASASSGGEACSCPVCRGEQSGGSPFDAPIYPCWIAVGFAPGKTAVGFGGTLSGALFALVAGDAMVEAQDAKKEGKIQ